MPHPATLARALALVTSSTVVLSAGLVGPAQARIQSPDTAEHPVLQRPLVAPGAVAVDGTIDDLLSRDGVVYVRGDFHRIGRFVGSDLRLDPTSGARLPAPVVNGQVSVSVPDGSGGWFLGGDFSAIGDHAFGGLAHVAADGTPDPDFAPYVHGDVGALALQGTTLFVGGQFDEIGGRTRHNLAAVSTTTGKVTSFTSSRPGRVTELELLGPRLYVGGEQLVAVHPDSGVVDPGFTPAVEGTVRALTGFESHLYVGGRGLVDLDATTGELNPQFAPTPEPFGQLSGRVHTLMVAGDRLYTGGSFSSLGGSPGPLVALNLEDGSADSTFVPAITMPPGSDDKGVFDTTLIGDDLWVGGRFSRVAGKRVTNLVAVDALTGARRTTSLPALNGSVNAVDQSADALRVGGAFFLADSVAARGMAALDAHTLLPVPGFEGHRIRWGEMVSGRRAIYVAPTHFSADYALYSANPDIRAIDPRTGAAIERLELENVRNLTGITTIGDRLYVAQRIGTTARFPRNRITVYSQRTGKRVDSFLLPLPGYVTQLASAGSDLLVAGSFRRTRPSGQLAHLAMLRVRSDSGELRSAFDPQTNGPINNVVVQGRALYASGYFNRADYGVGHAVTGVARFRLPGAGLDFDERFRPAYNRNGGQLPTPLGDLVMLGGYGWGRFVDAITGRAVDAPVRGYRRVTYLATRAGGAVVFVGTLYQTLGGNGFYRMSFVARGD